MLGVLHMEHHAPIIEEAEKEVCDVPCEGLPAFVRFIRILCLQLHKTLFISERYEQFICKV